MIVLIAMLLTVQPEVLTLADALAIAEAQQPQLRLARANVDIAKAREGEARATLLPQVVGTGSYQRTTANFVARPGLLPSQVNMAMTTAPSFNTFNFWNFGLTLSQYVWDFRAPFAFGATRASVEAQSAGERSTRQQVRLSVRTTFFTARAQRSLADVARDNVANQARHLKQIRGFVDAGARPEIDVAQAETDLSNADVQQINAENAYRVAKVQLNQAMGLARDTSYEVADDALPPVDGEDAPVGTLFAEAVKARPDLIAFDKQIRAQRLTVAATKGGFGPTFGVSMTINDAGTDIGALTWNWNTTVNASWALFDGLLTYSQVKEAQANLHGIEAQRDTLTQQVMVDVSQAQLQVHAARETFVAASKSVVSAKLQLKLAEGRYEVGVGNVIELGDAQLAATNASALRVQAEYNLAIARAQLLRALGRP